MKRNLKVKISALRNLGPPFSPQLNLVWKSSAIAERYFRSEMSSKDPESLRNYIIQEKPIAVPCHPNDDALFSRGLEKLKLEMEDAGSNIQSNLGNLARVGVRVLVLESMRGRRSAVPELSALRPGIGQSRRGGNDGVTANERDLG